MEGHLAQDAQTFADWGVDYLKVNVLSTSAMWLPDGTPGWHPGHLYKLTSIFTKYIPNKGRKAF
jgi:hypothetical protein